MLKLENLHYRYGRTQPEVLRDVNLSLNRGEIGVLMGRNGSGKTTLLRTILGIYRPTAGTILFQGHSLTDMPAQQRARKIAYVPQEITFGNLSVADTVLTGRIAHFGMRATAEDRAIVQKILQDLELSDFAHRPADCLSGGEKQKVAIARALAAQPELMVFDEPTGNLDLANEQLLMRQCRTLAREKGIAVLCSLHGLNEALELGDRFYFLKDGVIRQEGGTECFTAERIADVFGVSVRIAQIDHKNYVLGGFGDES